MRVNIVQKLPWAMVVMPAAKVAERGFPGTWERRP